MALSETEKAQIRMYLGWSQRHFQDNPRLEMAFSAVTAEAEVIIKAELASCILFDQRIDAATKRFKAHEVGSITLQGETELSLLRSLGRQHVGRIARTLGVDVMHDVFSGASPSSSQSNWLLVC
jgi:hypothetical protein